MTVLRNWNLNLNADDILRAQGADPVTIRNRRPVLVEFAEWALKEGLPLLAPQVLFQQYPVKRMRHERLELDPQAVSIGQVLTGKLIAQHLGPAQKVIAILCTIGPALEETASELMKTDPMLGWALDSLGSSAVEALALEACNYFEAKASEEGMQTSLPLNPGMIGWPVEEGQPQIFSLLDAREIGVSLTSGGQMQPRKSLSMILGVGREMGKAGRTCDYCSLSETCKYQNHYASISS